MPRVYIAGPMRGHPELNFPAFDRAAALGRSLGWTVISPAEMDRAAKVDEKEWQGQPVNGGDPAAIRVFILRDVDVIVNVLKAEEGDAIALLPGWQGSTGARGEKALGDWAKLRMLNALSFTEYREGVSSCSTGQCMDGTLLAAQAFADGKL